MNDISKVCFLVVDDDEIDTEAILRAFRKNGFENPVQVARNGEEALAILRSELSQGNTFGIFLDLNMPRMDGFEFLEILRSDPLLKNSVVFVLTTSDAAEDKRRAYQYNVAGYILKSKMLQDLNGVIAFVNAYWSSVEPPIGASRSRRSV